jgi:hypothetical protein
MKIVVVGHPDRHPSPKVCVLQTVFVTGVSSPKENTLESYLDHRNHDWYRFGDSDLPSKADIVINLYSSFKKLNLLNIGPKGPTILNPKSSHRYTHDPFELYKLLDKLKIDHPLAVSSGVYPAVLRGLGGFHQNVSSKGEENMQKNTIRLEKVNAWVGEVYKGEFIFRLMMMGNTPYFLFGSAILPNMENLSGELYENIITHGIKVVKTHWDVFSRIQQVTHLTGISIDFCLRNGDIPCILAVETAMGVPIGVFAEIDALKVKKTHVRYVRDALLPEGFVMSFDMLLPNLKLKKSLILSSCPKTAGSTLKLFFQTHFSECYLLYREENSDYVIHDRHGKPTLPNFWKPFILCTTHHGISSLPHRFIPQEIFDTTFKVITVRDVLSRVGSIHKGSRIFDRLSFDKFCKTFLNQKYYRIMPKDYRNMSRECALIHLNPQSDWVDESHDWLVHMEHISEDMRHVMVHITDDHYDLDWLNRGKCNVRTPPYTVKMSEESHNIVLKFYSRDKNIKMIPL